MNAIIFGTGEYVSGWTGASASKSDKSLGVVALVHFDLKRRGLIPGGKIALVGTNPAKFGDIRDHFEKNIRQRFSNIESVEFEEFPRATQTERDPKAYLTALKEFSKPGDICSVFTPDETHYEIIDAALDHGLHVMATKPMVKTLEDHQKLVEKARSKNLLLQIEVHKRFDPMYNDAVMRICNLGEFNFFTSYMSQPKFQLETFKAWAGISSDISYYLNSHHIDLHCWAMQRIGCKCIAVRANASRGVVAEKMPDLADGRICEDTITITADWQNKSGSIGHAVYTASWTAAKADVHSQQRFFCLMEKGEVTTDQCHRGYTIATDESNGLSSLNPLYIRNVPDVHTGEYIGQQGYGYVSFEKFVEAAAKINAGTIKAADLDDGRLPTGATTAIVTAILEAGRKSLDDAGRKVEIIYSGSGEVVSVK